jgi:hypothetical protein
MHVATRNTQVNQTKQTWHNDYRIAAALSAMAGFLVLIIAEQFSEHLDIQGPSIFYGWLAGTILYSIHLRMVLS